MRADRSSFDSVPLRSSFDSVPLRLSFDSVLQRCSVASRPLDGCAGDRILPTDPAGSASGLWSLVPSVGACVEDKTHLVRSNPLDTTVICSLSGIPTISSTDSVSTPTIVLIRLIL